MIYNVVRGDGAFLETDDFEDGISQDGEADETNKLRILKQLGADNAQLEYGSLDREESKQKSHKEVMEEVMLKDKYYRAQKAKGKGEDEQMMTELDKKFEDWVNSQGFNALSNKANSKESLEKGPDSYDKQVRRLAGDMRAAPSDRTKTPEEIALEDKQRLEQLEEERQKRMDGDSSDEESNDDTEDSYATSSRKVRSTSGDNLGDSLSLDEKEVGHKKGWVEDKFEREGGSSIEDEDNVPSEESDGGESGEEDGNEEDNVKSWKSSSLKDWEQSDDGDDLSVDLEEDNEDGGEEIEDSLPFVIEAPKTFSELSKLLENRSDAEIINKSDTCIFYANLLMYFAILTTKKPLNFKLLNLLVKPLLEMSMDIPFYAAVCAREPKSYWPSLKTLCLLRLWSITFPCSDFRHAVMTPAMLLICEYLVRCPITSCRDIAMGSFLCSMVLLILFVNDRVSVLVTLLDILRGFVQVYGGYNSFPEIFMPISTLLNEVSKQNHIPDQLQEKINDVTKQIFVRGRDYDPDSEQSEVKKLRKRLKREAKGAASELRKDNKFLAVAKMKAIAVEKQERAEKVRKTMAFLEEQQHAFYSGALGGKGKKSR
ncbi:hypothetical protein MKX01_039500 [Papaver californicum]|nr:hypothetical protein MKX01_039500 [Papaver californicum]